MQGRSPAVPFRETTGIDVCVVVLRAVRAGGNFNNGTNVSPLYFNCNNTVENANFNYGGG